MSLSEIEGFNPQDPGVALLANAARGRACDALLVHCGPIPGLGDGATRLVLDVREHSGYGERCVPWTGALEHDSGTPDEGASGLARCWPLALVWPRAHLGKDFTELCLALAATHVERDGAVLCAVRKARGGPSIARFMNQLLGNVRVVARDRGYHLYRADRASELDRSLAAAALSRRYLVRDPLLEGLELVGAPGVFSRKQLDKGTAALLRCVTAAARDAPAVRRVLDLGCGLGPLALWAARRWPTARVLAVDANRVAVALTRHNAARAGCAERVVVHAGDGLPTDAIPGPLTAFHGACELALINPPTHAPAPDFTRLVTSVRAWLRPGGDAWYVVNRSGRLRQALAGCGAATREIECEGYTVVRARWP